MDSNGVNIYPLVAFMFVKTYTPIDVDYSMHVQKHLSKKHKLG